MDGQGGGIATLCSKGCSKNTALRAGRFGRSIDEGGGVWALFKGIVKTKQRLAISLFF